MQKSQFTELSSPPSFLGLPSIRGLIEGTDLHIALFIVANGNTAVKQLSKVAIWGAEGLNLQSMGQPEQIIAKWYEYNCYELKGSVGWQSPQPIT